VRLDVRRKLLRIRECKYHGNSQIFAGVESLISHSKEDGEVVTSFSTLNFYQSYYLSESMVESDYRSAATNHTDKGSRSRSGIGFVRDEQYCHPKIVIKDCCLGHLRQIKVRFHPTSSPLSLEIF
jgi:hypothetical protein